MGLFDKLKAKSRGILTAAKPDAGVPSLSKDEVVRRLTAISGKGITTTTSGDEVVVAWAAKVDSVGIDGGEHEHLYRAIRIELDEGRHEATGICLKTTSNAEIDFGGASFSFSKGWERGQHIGSEKLHVLAWLGPHRTEGGADEQGYTFSWSDLRGPVLDAVTGAGWTYTPKKA